MYKESPESAAKVTLEVMLPIYFPETTTDKKSTRTLCDRENYQLRGHNP